jgi:hypothetical protein
LVANTVVIGSKIEVVGRVSRQLLDCLKIELGQVIRSGAIGNRSLNLAALHPSSVANSNSAHVSAGLLILSFNRRRSSTKKLFDGTRKRPGINPTAAPGQKRTWRPIYDVRLSPQSRHSPARLACRLWATSGHPAICSITSSATARRVGYG